MNPVIEGKVCRMYLDAENKGIEELGRFLGALHGRHFFGNRYTSARRGFHKIEIRESFSHGEGENNILFLLVPIKRTEKMISLGWTFI